MRNRVTLILLLTCILAACHVELVVKNLQPNGVSGSTVFLSGVTPSPTEMMPPAAKFTAEATLPPATTATPQPIVRSVDSGEGHSCALTSDGTVYCWGRNQFGQLGDGTAEDRDEPVQVAGLDGVQALAVGWGHSCAISNEGSVLCWGYNEHGELGDGTTIHKSQPVHVKGISAAAESLRVGENHACVITERGEVQCWGFNRFGQLGDGSAYNRYSAVNVGGLEDVRSLALGWEHTCALIAAGAVYCWGNNEFGQLGMNSYGQNIILPVEVEELGGPVRALSANGNHTCALLENGQAQCWGNNEFGQIGDGTVEDRAAPTSVIGIEDVRALASGGFHNCAIAGKGNVLCWGGNQFGQLGFEERSPQRYLTEPVPVMELPDVVADMGLGWRHTCVVLESGEIACWGTDDHGQVWNDWQLRPSAEACTQLKVAKPLDSGGWHSCSVIDDGRAICWGANGLGQLGVGTRNSYAAPVVVEGLGSNVVSVATGGNQSCALLLDGTVMCWGANYSGELGDGTTSDRTEPEQVDGLLDIVKGIAAGGGHTCAALREGVVCWGADNNNQRSNLLDKDYVIGLQGCVQDIASLYDHTCAVTSTGEVYCWGLNDHGQLGNNTTTPNRGAVRVIGLESDMAHVATGKSHSCALSVDGRVKCWGDNSKGQLGDGTQQSHLTAVEVAQGIDRAVGIAAGFNHTCYLTTTGRVKCWGNGVDGQLGNGTRGTQFLPTEVAGLENVAYIEAGESHTCALLADGTIMCWGSDIVGQLGDGGDTDIFSSVPVEIKMYE